MKIFEHTPCVHVVMILYLSKNYDLINAYIYIFFCALYAKVIIKFKLMEEPLNRHNHEF